MVSSLSEQAAKVELVELQLQLLQFLSAEPLVVGQVHVSS